MTKAVEFTDVLFAAECLAGYLAVYFEDPEADVAPEVQSAAVLLARHLGYPEADAPVDPQSVSIHLAAYLDDPAYRAAYDAQVEAYYENPRPFLCSRDDCERRAFDRGLCKGHYAGWWALNGPAFVAAIDAGMTLPDCE